MSSDLLTRLGNHVAQMAPHQKERSGAKLLVEAAEEIERLLGIIARDQEELREALRRACSEHQGRIERLKAVASPVTQNREEDVFYETGEKDL